MAYNLEKEIWRPVVGYEGIYEISNIGRVKVLKRYMVTFKNKNGFWKDEQVMVSVINKRGYTNVSLTKEGVSKVVKVHRLVAISFIDNPDNKPTVNHINGIKSDNRVENLEWATYSEQQRHAYRVLNKQKSLCSIGGETHPSNKKVKCDTLGMIFPSATLAAKAVGGTKTDIANYISGKRINRYGLVFRYI